MLQLLGLLHFLSLGQMNVQHAASLAGHLYYYKPRTSAKSSHFGTKMRKKTQNQARMPTIASHQRAGRMEWKKMMRPAPNPAR